MYLEGIGIYSYPADPPTENAMVCDGYWHDSYSEEPDEEEVEVNFEVDTSSLSLKDEEDFVNAADKIFSLCWYEDDRIAEFSGYTTEEKLEELNYLIEDYNLEVNKLN